MATSVSLENDLLKQIIDFSFFSTKKLTSPNSSVPPPGRDFLIQVNPIDRSIERRQVISTRTGYLDSTGQIQPICQRGSIFRLVGGQLFSGLQQISVPRKISSARFGTSEDVEALDGIFAIAPGEVLMWNNDAFEGGSARFGADTVGVVSAFFSGPLASNYVAVSLEARGSKLTITLIRFEAIC